MDITGVVVAVIVLFALLFILNLVSIQRRLALRIDWGRMIGIPVISAGVSGVVIFLINLSLIHIYRNCHGEIPSAVSVGFQYISRLCGYARPGRRKSAI